MVKYEYNSRKSHFVYEFYPTETIKDEQIAPGVPKPATPRVATFSYFVLPAHRTHSTFQKSAKTVANDQQNNASIRWCVSQDPTTEIVKYSRMNSCIIDKPRYIFHVNDFPLLCRSTGTPYMALTTIHIIGQFANTIPLPMLSNAC